MISIHGFELSNQIDCNNLVGPIGLHVMFHYLGLFNKVPLRLCWIFALPVSFSDQEEK